MIEPVTFRVRVELRADPSHVRVTIWAGRTPGSRGNCGTLMMHPDEAIELSRRLVDPEDQP